MQNSFYINSRLKWLIIGLLFLILPTFALRQLIEHELYHLLPLIAGFFPFAPASFWAYYDLVKNRYISDCSISPSYTLLFTGYTFTFVGFSMAYIQLAGIFDLDFTSLTGAMGFLASHVFVLMGSFFAFLGLFMLVGFIRNRLAGYHPEQVYEADRRVQVWVGLIAGGTVLLGIPISTILAEFPTFVTVIAFLAIIPFAVIAWLVLFRKRP
ncbi:MAG: hypothetical protein CSA81_01235 [Acidobacteria bacterium]|nr:MAG: hypothetical protein CSA81_01235 [Acidobacteriota bacterium]